MKNKRCHVTQYAEVTPQDLLVEIFPQVYLLRGSIKIAPLLQMNRNMLIIKQGQDLTLINAVRLNDEGLKQLAEMGTVKHLIRLGDFHGLDDQFYIDQFQPTFWSQQQHVLYPNLKPNQIIDQDSVSPIANSQFFIFESALYPEAALLLKDHQLLITTDSVQYWDDWKYMTRLSKFFLYLMGFRLKLFIGGPWLKKVSAQKSSLKTDFENLLKLDFKHVVAAHGNMLKNCAKEELERVVVHTFK